MEVTLRPSSFEGPRSHDSQFGPGIGDILEALASLCMMGDVSWILALKPTRACFIYSGSVAVQTTLDRFSNAQTIHCQQRLANSGAYGRLSYRAREILVMSNWRFAPSFLLKFIHRLAWAFITYKPPLPPISRHPPSSSL